MKKFLLMALSLVTVAVMAVVGTVAYLQSQDSDVNVMTTGNVKIEQHEYERKVNDDGTYATIETVRGESYELTEFIQAKSLLPAVGTVTGWEDTKVLFAQLADGEVKQGDMHYYGYMDVLAGLNNVQDKFVFVENTGKTDAYVRTIIAYEAGSKTAAEWDALIARSENSFWKMNELGVMAIEGNNYVIVEYVYDGNQYPEGGEPIENANGRHPDGIVHPGDWTYNSLAQVYMMSAATNEDVEALDGNDNGTYDILVLSQAVQADGFADAKTALDNGIGVVDAKNVAEWFAGMEFPVVPKGYPVNNDTELAAAIAAGETEIWLNPGTYKIPAVANGKSVILNGTTESIVDHSTALITHHGANYTFNGITIKGTTENYKGLQAGDVVYNKCVFNGGNHLYSKSVTFNDCTFNLTSQYITTYGAVEVTFDNCTWNTAGKALLVFQDGASVDQVVTVKDNTFNATAAAYTWNGIQVAAVSIDGSANTTQGTFDVKFEGTNTVDADFAGLCQIKGEKGNVTVTGATPTELTYKQ